MKLKTIFLIFIAASTSLLLLSCIRSNSSNNLVESLKEIKILPNVSNDKELLDIIKNVEIIPLETNDNCLLGFIYSLKYKNDRFYIQTSGGENPLYVFNKKGNHIKSIGRHGRGPEEYLHLGKFMIDDKITIYSTEKTLHYSLDGLFLHEEKPKLSFSKIVKLDNNLYALHFGIGLITSSLVAKIGGTPSGVVLADSSFNILSEYDIRPEHRNKIGYHSNTFSKYKETVYFRDNYESIIYSINKQEIKPEYYLNFGKYQVDDDFLIKIMNEHPIEYVRQIQNEFATFIKHYHNDKYLWIGYHLNFNNSFNPHFAIYSRDNSSVMNFNLENNNPINRIFSRIESNDDYGRFIFSVDAVDFIEISKSIEEQVNNGSMQKKDFMVDILLKAKEINEDDNPIMIILTLK